MEMNNADSSMDAKMDLLRPHFNAPIIDYYNNLVKWLADGETNEKHPLFHVLIGILEDDGNEDVDDMF